ncbi:MAG: hypothetical protein HY314_00520 [Acidobacteria bacterium]|nr:hypothetical protein [Acidobacteriota bacterium]
MTEATHFPPLLFLQADAEDLTGLIAVAGFYVAVIGIAVFFFLKTTKERQFMHKERMALIERMESLPENAYQILVSFAPAKDRDLRNGLLWLIGGRMRRSNHRLEDELWLIQEDLMT